MVTSSGRTAGMAANSASSISSRGWARVTSHTEMATRWPARTSVPSGGRPIGAASAAVSAARGSDTGGSNSGVTISVRSSGTSTSSPSLP